jgi:hypothetical protein
MTAMAAKVLFWFYLTNAILLIIHEIDSAIQYAHIAVHIDLHAGDIHDSGRRNIVCLLG